MKRKFRVNSRRRSRNHLASRFSLRDVWLPGVISCVRCANGVGRRSLGNKSGYTHNIETTKMKILEIIEENLLNWRGKSFKTENEDEECDTKHFVLK